MEDADAEVDVDQGAVEAPPGRTEVSWIVVHPDRNAVLVMEADPRTAVHRVARRNLAR